MSFWNLTHRVREDEDIDDPALPTDQLHGALDGLTTINFLSASAGILWKPIRALARRTGKTRLRILDIATGAGDLPLALWRRSRRSGLQLEIEGLDISERVLDFARRRAKAHGAPLEFRSFDVLSDELPTNFDVIMTSLFLHHLETDQVSRLLASMARATNHLVLANDLRRSRVGLFLAYAAGHFLTRSPVVHKDALLSVRAAFTLPEIRELATVAGLNEVKLSRKWPYRYLLEWEKAPGGCGLP